MILLHQSRLATSCRVCGFRGKGKVLETMAEDRVSPTVLWGILSETHGEQDQQQDLERLLVWRHTEIRESLQVGNVRS